jgi:beta-lactamase class C
VGRIERIVERLGDGVVGSCQAAWTTGERDDAACGGNADPTTRFALASLTKPLVAIACLVACEEEVLDLDEPIGRHLPEVAMPEATLRELLSHASGLPADDAVARRVQLDPAAGWPDVRGAYLAVTPATPARGRRVYANTGYAVAAAVLEAATGLGYAAYVEEAVLRPLGMVDTAFGCAVDDPRVSRVVEPGLLGAGEPLFNGGRFRALGLPQSGAYGTAADYLRVVRLALDRGCLPDGRVLLSPESADLLVTTQFGDPPGGVGGFMEWDACAWAIGFDVRSGKSPHWTGAALSPRAATHFGASGTLAFADPALGVGGVLLANRGTYSRWMLEPGAWPDFCAAIADEAGEPTPADVVAELR